MVHASHLNLSISGGWRPPFDLRRFMQISGQMRGVPGLEMPIALPRRCAFDATISARYAQDGRA
jgi:hypothetical protein